MTRRSIAQAAGRSSQLGEGMNLTPSTNPSLLMRSLCGKAIGVHSLIINQAERAARV
jgi:hypothetical protein